MNPELFFGQTDTGRQRDNNEDAFIAENISKDRFIAACVIDGVGGYEGGEVAAAIAKETILDTLKTASNDPLELMKSSFLLANQKIYEQRLADSNKSNMACVLTLALVDLSNNQFYYAHVGDTRLYLFRDQSLVKLSRDHSFVGFLEDNKKISEEEAMRHPKRNEINKALGFDPNMSSVTDYIETGSSPFLPGDILLLCSDGLSDMIDSQTMISVLSSSGSLKQKTAELIKAANEAGGKDNITAVLVQNNKKPVKQKATKPALVKKKDQLRNNTNNVADDDIKDTPVVLVKKTSRKGIAFLIVLCLLLMAAVFYLWNYPRVKEPPEEQQQTVVVAKTRNAAEQKFIDSLQQRSVLSLSDSIYGQMVITDSIFLNKDSLHIKGNGVTIISDTSYKGTAFVIPSSSKYIVLENLTIKNFDVGIRTQNKKLILKNVRFENCRVPVQADFLLTQNQFVNGRIDDSILFQNDTIPKR
ncbi:MAG: PP2C family protein-serine/threonine phosphatase [Flavisolibacter sp.]